MICVLQNIAYSVMITCTLLEALATVHPLTLQGLRQSHTDLQEEGEGE